MAKVWASYTDYLASPEWDELSTLAKARDGFRCRMCNSPRNLHAHHRRYPRFWSDDDPENLTTLCCSCHERHHHDDAPGLGAFIAPGLIAGLTGFALGWLACASF